MKKLLLVLITSLLWSNVSIPATWEEMEKLKKQIELKENQNIKIDQNWVEDQTVQSLLDNQFNLIISTPVLANEDYVIFNLGRKVGEKLILVTCFVTPKNTKCRIP